MTRRNALPLPDLTPEKRQWQEPNCSFHRAVVRMNGEAVCRRSETATDQLPDAHPEYDGGEDDNDGQQVERLERSIAAVGRNAEPSLDEIHERLLFSGARPGSGATRSRPEVDG